MDNITALYEELLSAPLGDSKGKYIEMVAAERVAAGLALVAMEIRGLAETLKKKDP